MWRSCVAAAALTLALTGCTAAPEPGGTPSGAAAALPAGLEAELIQLRSDVAARQAEVRLRNGGEATIEVGAVEVADPRFAAPARRVVDRTTVLAAGHAVDVRVQLADARCDPASTTDTPPQVTIHGTRDGAPFAATVPIAELIPFLAALHERECVQAGAAASADIALGAFAASDASAAAALDLVVTPRPGEGRLRITGIRGTNLLTFDGIGPGGELPLDVDQTGGDRSAVTVPLPVRPARCDPHAVLEDKRGTVFRLQVEVDGVAGSFDLAADPVLRGELLAWVARWCGYGQ